MPKCPECGSSKVVALYADSVGVNSVYIIEKCKDCGKRFRKREKLPRDARL